MKREVEVAPPASEDRGWRPLLGRAGGFLLVLARRFAAHDGPQSAAALTYTTLLSLVPLMTVVLAIFSAFPVAERVSVAVQDFLFANFVPASGEVLRSYLQEFSDKASRLTGVGFAALIVVALLMMNSIDRALNAIWEVRQSRSHVNKFVVYWAILSLGPLLIGASVLVTSYMISLPLLSEAAASGLGKRLLGLTPVAASTLAFTLIYLLVPNRRVLLRHALAGGVLAAVLFEIAKRAFAWYLTSFPTYEAIYGALAIIPIFLVWVYLSWLVVLFGAEFTHALGIYRYGDDGREARRLEFADAIRVLGELWHAHRQGESRSLRQLAALEPHWAEYRLQDLLFDLQAMKLVLRTEDGHWAAARDYNQVALRELLANPRFRLPAPGQSDWPADPVLAEVLRAANERLTEPLGVPLAQFGRRKAETIPMSGAAFTSRQPRAGG